MLKKEEIIKLAFLPFSSDCFVQYVNWNSIFHNWVSSFWKLFVFSAVSTQIQQTDVY